MSKGCIPRSVECRTLHKIKWFLGLIFAHAGAVLAQWISIYYVPLRTRRALSLYKVYGDSAVLVLKETSLNSVNALLVFSWQYFLYTDSWSILIQIWNQNQRSINIRYKKTSYFVKNSSALCQVLFLLNMKRNGLPGVIYYKPTLVYMYQKRKKENNT